MKYNSHLYRILVLLFDSSLRSSFLHKSAASVVLVIGEHKFWVLYRQSKSINGLYESVTKLNKHWPNWMWNSNLAFLFQYHFLNRDDGTLSDEYAT